MIWKNGAIPGRFGCIYLCCHLHQARLTVPTIARGFLSRRPIHALNSPNLTCPNGVSAIIKNNIIEKLNKI